MAGFTLAPGVVPISTLATRPLDASAPLSTQNSSSSATTSGSTSNDYVFQVKPLTSLTPRSVDNGSAYVGAGGRETSVCGQAEIFTLQGNTLSTDGLWVSATSKTSWTWFAVSAQIGEMVTNFTLADGYLTWLNEAFDGGVAEFCATNKTVIAVYNGIAPTNCVPVRLFAIQTTFALCNDTNAAATTPVTSNSFDSSIASSTDATHTSSPSSIQFTADPSTLDVSPTLSFGSANSITISRSSVYDTDTPSSSSIATTTGPSNSSNMVTASSASPPNLSSTKPVLNSATETSMSSKSHLSSLDPSSIGTNLSVTTDSSTTPALGSSATRSNTPGSNTNPSATSYTSLSSSTTSSSTSSLSTTNLSTISSSMSSSSTTSSISPSAAISTSPTLSLSSTSTSQTTSLSTSSTSAPPSTSSPSSTAAPTSQATATSSPTSTYTYTTGVRLSHPTSLIANAVDSIQYDDVATNASVNFPIQLYEQRARNFTVTTNGLFAVGFADIADDTINTALYASALPPGTVCVFWKDLVAGPTAHQGIYYQIDVYGADSQLSVEYILSSYVDPNKSTSSPTQIYHAILVYDDDAFGLVELYYFSNGDGAANATIGVQGFDANHYPQAAQFEYNTTVAAGERINLVTDLNDSPNGTASLRSFNVACYGPGTWPVGTCG